MNAGFVLRVFPAGEPEGEGEEHAFVLDCVCIGRDDDCELVLQDDLVSRRHVRIDRTSTGFLLIDLESSNGVWVGEQRVERHLLVAGERFRLGRTWCQFSMPEVAPDAASAESTSATNAAMRWVSSTSNRR